MHIAKGQGRKAVQFAILPWTVPRRIVLMLLQLEASSRLIVILQAIGLADCKVSLSSGVWSLDASSGGRWQQIKILNH